MMQPDYDPFSPETWPRDVKGHIFLGRAMVLVEAAMKQESTEAINFINFVSDPQKRSAAEQLILGALEGDDLSSCCLSEDGSFVGVGTWSWRDKNTPYRLSSFLDPEFDQKYGHIRSRPIYVDAPELMRLLQAFSTYSINDGVADLDSLSQVDDKREQTTKNFEEQSAQEDRSRE